MSVSDRKIEKPSMQEEAEKKILEQKRVIVRIWTSGRNPDHRGSDVGHVSIETQIPNHYMSLWPKQHMIGEDGKPLMVEKRDEKSGEMKSRPVSAKDVEVGGKLPLLPVSGEFVPSFELDRSFDYENRKPEVTYCFYTLDVSAIVSHFNGLKEKYKSWVIAPAFSVMERDSAGSCASCAWELLLAGGIGKFISKQEQSVIASQGASQGASQAVRAVPPSVYSFFAKHAADEAKNAGSLDGSFYSSEMAISLLVKSPDALQKFLESAKRKELQEKPLTKGIAFAGETIVALSDPENSGKKSCYRFFESNGAKIALAAGATVGAAIAYQRGCVIS